MDQKILLFLLLLLFSSTLVLALEQSQDFLGLKALECKNLPPNWEGSDPCGSNWEGTDCTDSRITAITLSSMGLVGKLSGDLDQLTELETLDLSYNTELTGALPQSIGNLKKLSNLILVGCGFSGKIPDSIGSLTELVFLSMNLNRFSGSIPSSIGNLSKLYWLDLADNLLEGPIPVSDDTSPGLDMLLHCRHFHFGNNKLSGVIPEKLFNADMNLIHVLFDGNDLTGSIPLTLGLVHSLETLRLDGNKLSDTVPENLSNLTKLTEMYLSNNKLSGPLPNFTGLDSLNYLDISNNSFDASGFPLWPMTFLSLTTLMMEDTQLRGSIPKELFDLPNLETVVLKGNTLNGTLEIGPSHGSHLQRIDLKSNLISEYKGDFPELQIILVDNPYCLETGKTDGVCSAPVSQSINGSYVTGKNNCAAQLCSNPDLVSSPNCKCAYPYTGTLHFRAPTFSDLGNDTHFKLLEQNLTGWFKTHTSLVDSVSLSNPYKDPTKYLEVKLQVFPSNGEHFNRTEISHIGFYLSNQTYKPPKTFGPFYFVGTPYESFAESGIDVTKGKSSNSNLGIIIGAAAGGSALVLLLVIAGVYAIRQKRRAEKAAEQSNPFVRWETESRRSGGAPQIKGAKWFSFEELKKYTNNFSSSNDIGSGGYGKVYRGTLPTGQLVAIKRAQRESNQGGLEFKTELELLSRVHHKNLVTLVGFCFDKGEHILIYEYVPNGSLKDSLTGKSGIKLDWPKRLRVALGTARGLAYLHELANPPIIHRDIKSTNVLLDSHLNAKVGDFGLSKLMGDGDKDHITTQVKGTMGYLDPEYYMTQQLTEKSDVYSFGVLMLELITAKKPIDKGKYIVREIRTATDKTKEMYNLHEFLDPNIGTGTRLPGFERFVDLAMRCVQDSGEDRPTMSEVVIEIESIMQLAGLNPKVESASPSASFEEANNKRSPSNPYTDEVFDNSGSYPPSMVEPQ